MATSTTYLERTFAAGDRRKWTWSAWVKRANLGSNNWLFHTYLAGNNENSIFFNPSDQLAFSIYTGTNDNGRLTTNRLFRDTSSWYHLQFVWDTGNSTAGNRMRIYVNGVEETSFATDTNPPLNYEAIFNSGINHTIGQYGDNTSSMRFSGSMSHVHFSDGYALAPTVFGETDSTTGEWKIITNPTFTLGTNGFSILKDGNTITDQSSNSNNWSSAGTLTKTEDSPSNVFATWNPLIPDVATLSNGNTTSSNTSTSNWNRASCTLADTKGKYYAEFKMTTIVSAQVGIIDVDQVYGTTAQPRNSSRAYMYKENGQKGNNSLDSNYGATYTDGDIIGVAVDLDNNKIYFSKNGVFENSGVPTSGSTGTGSAFDLADGYFYTFINGNFDSSGNGKIEANFGNGYFGTTAVSSAGTNASGIGIFEYDVPTGYTALSTEGLNL